jgi:hypothetical protein
MVLPVQSIRAKPQHRDLLQRVAEILRGGGEPILRKMIERVDARPVGPFLSEETALAFLRDRLVAALKPKAIWLFGSRARGDAHTNSDFDLLVVLPDGRGQDALSEKVVSSPVMSCGLGYDIVPCTWSDFIRDRTLPGSLVNRAITEGRAIYRNPTLRALERTVA